MILRHKLLRFLYFPYILWHKLLHFNYALMTFISMICHVLGYFGMFCDMACFERFREIIIVIYEDKLHFATQIIAILGENRNNLCLQ